MEEPASIRISVENGTKNDFISRLQFKPASRQSDTRPTHLEYAYCMPHPGDAQLVQILDAALADAARRSGDWLVCRPGCTQCCVGVFAVSQLDAQRLRAGMEELQATDPARATAVRNRARDSIARLAS